MCESQVSQIQSHIPLVLLSKYEVIAAYVPIIAHNDNHVSFVITDNLSVIQFVVLA